MNCPMCMQLMKEHSSTSYVPFYHYEDEETYYTKQKIVTYTCVKCKVTCRNDVWILPENDRPTEKQQLAISFIQNELGLSYDGITKYDAWLFIHGNLEEAHEAYKEDIDNNDDYRELEDLFDF